MSEALPDYYLLLREAQEAADKVDNFDVKPFNRASVEEFNELTTEADEAQGKLIAYVRDNLAALESNFGVEIKPAEEEGEEEAEEVEE